MIPEETHVAEGVTVRSVGETLGIIWPDMYLHSAAGRPLPLCTYREASGNEPWETGEQKKQKKRNAAKGAEEKFRTKEKEAHGFRSFVWNFRR